MTVYFYNRANVCFEFFADQHILRPTRSPTHFISTYARERYLYKIEKRLIKFIGRARGYSADDQEQPTLEEETIEDMIKYNVDPETDTSLVRILSIEKGYNNQYQPYNILIVEHPLLHSYRDQPEDDIVVTALVDGYKKQVLYFYKYSIL